jgi:hypothetical protein
LERVRAEVLTAERAVLYTLCFQLRIKAPYSTVLQLTKGQKDGQDTTNLIQMAWQLVNDRYDVDSDSLSVLKQLQLWCQDGMAARE